MNIWETINTLTGFEEIGVEKATGYTLEELSDQGTKDNPKPNRQGMLIRAMAAVVIARRDETTIAKAWAEVLKMRRDEIPAVFPEDTEDPEEPFPDEPITESGKDESVSGTEPTSSPPSTATQASASATTSS